MALLNPLGSLTGAAVVLAVVYVVVSLFFRSLNPLAWLYQESIALRPTLLELAEVTEISELITSEYYGEVLASLDELTLKLETEVASVYQQLHQELTQGACYSQAQDDQAKRQCLSEDLLNTIAYKYISDRYTYILDRIKTGQSVEDYIRMVDASTFDEMHFSCNYDNCIRKKIERTYRDKELVYLARGKVRATYDLASLSEDSISCLTDAGTPERNPMACHGSTRHTLRLTLPDTSLRVVASINPWFATPQDDFAGLPGYTVLNEGKITGDFELIRQVRALAEQKLMDTALRHGLDRNAETVLVRTLKGLLATIMNLDPQRITIEIGPTDRDR